MGLAKEIYALTEYGIRCKLIEEEDRIYIINRYLELFHVDEFALDEVNKAKIQSQEIVLEDVLENLMRLACEYGIMPDDSVTQKDLFDTKLMGIMVARPSDIIKKFQTMYEKSAQDATDWFYDLSQNTNYIRRDRIKKDRKWKSESEYGDMDITINLSKPEKDPKEIAAAKLAAPSNFPLCLLCVENEGYAGRLNHPARQNHRIIPIEIQGNKWGFQYSPYVYYNEHCIVFNGEHTPMKIERSTFIKLFDFVKLFPHYFLGSNADLPIVGGSILSHDHFQGGNYEFAMAKAPYLEHFTISNFEDVETGIVKWPMSVIRLRCENEKRIIDLADKILTAWRSYTDEAAFIYAETDGEPHNTITPIARFKDGKYELDLVLRNNITTEEYPMGLYHPHEELHHIKKENIGLIEVMGLAVLPSRLKAEMELLKEYILTGKDLTSNEDLAKHADWAGEFIRKYDHINSENIDKIIQDEIGLVFTQVLECAGVYKQTDEGLNAFRRFIKTL